MVGEILVAGRLARLALEIGKLGVERRDHVLQPVQVGFRRPQAQLGFVAPGMEPGDARRLLQQRAAVAGPGLDDGFHLALAHQRGRPRPGGGVGEQNLDVAGADVLAVDAVLRPRAAFDAPGDFQLVPVVEGGGRGALRIIQAEGHFGDVPGRPVDGAAEDEVVHLFAAQAARRVLAHGPLQGFHQIGLAAAVGADDPGHAGFDQQLRVVDEGLETGEAELGEQHAGARLTFSPWPRGGRGWP